MSTRQFLSLCVCHFITFTGISAFVEIMPLYLIDVGANASTTGFFLATMYLSLALSTVLGGYLSHRLQRRTLLLIFGGALAAPITWSMQGITAAALLLTLMACLWFVTGVVITMTNILVGLLAEEGRQGHVFGVLHLSSGLGLFFGSLISGRVVDQWGFPALFVLMAALYLILPFVGLLI